MTIQCNKHGIPVVTPKKKQQKVKSINHLNHKEFAEFIRFVDGIEVRVTVLNFKPIINAMKSDGWITHDELKKARKARKKAKKVM